MKPLVSQTASNRALRSPLATTWRGPHRGPRTVPISSTQGSSEARRATATPTRRNRLLLLSGPPLAPPLMRRG
eukprot:6272654-Pyramimonas_sp.AAC.1